MGGGIVSLNLISVFIHIPERLLLVQVNQQLILNYGHGEQLQ